MKKSLKSKDFLELLKKVIGAKDKKELAQTVSSSLFKTSGKFFLKNTLKLSGFTLTFAIYLVDYIYFFFVSSRVNKAIRIAVRHKRDKEYKKIIKEIKDAKEPIDVIQAHKKLFNKS